MEITEADAGVESVSGLSRARAGDFEGTGYSTLTLRLTSLRQKARANKRRLPATVVAPRVSIERQSPAYAASPDATRNTAAPIPSAARPQGKFCRTSPEKPVAG